MKIKITNLKITKMPDIFRRKHGTTMILLGAGILSAWVPVLAQTTSSLPGSADAAKDSKAVQKTRAAKDATKKTNETQKQGFTVDAGYLYRPKPAASTARDDYYYRLEFNGTKVAAHSEAFQESSFYRDDAPITKPTPEPDLLLRFENGAGEGVGPVADFFKAQPFQAAPGSFLSNISGVAQLYGTVDNSKLSFAAGLEYRPIQLIRGTGVTNWINVGVQAAAETPDRSSSSSTDDARKNKGFGTLRSYFAGSGNYVRSAASLNAQKSLDAFRVQYLTDYQALAKQAPKGINPSPSVDFKAATQDLTENEQHIVAVRLSDVNQFAFATRVLRDDGKLSDIQGLGVKGSIYGDPKDWELDPAAFYDALKHAPDVAQSPLVRVVLTQLRSLFQIDAPLPKPILFPQALWDRENTLFIAPDSTERRWAISDRLSYGMDSLLLTPDTVSGSAQDIRQKAIIETLDPNLPADYRVDQALKDQKLERHTELANRLLIEALFPDQVRGLTPVPENKAIWQKKLELTFIDLFLLPDKPTYTYSFEDVGQVQALGGYDRSTDGPRLRNLLGATFTYYLDPQQENRHFIKLRYENGTDRTAATVYRNQIMFTLGFEL